MTMSARHGIYRAFIKVYPSTFRRDYGEDLVQHFDDLVVDRGRRRAWTRTGLDLVVTVPNYRLEQVMSRQRSATTLSVIIGLAFAAGLASLLAGIYVGLAFFGVAVAVGVTQRSSLAKALRTPVVGLRRRRLTVSAVLALVFVVCAGVYLALIGDTWTSRESVLAGVGTLAMIGAPIFFVVGLLTPKADPAPVA